MYQGKFDKKRKKTSLDIQEITASRNAAAAAAAQKKSAPVREEVSAAPAAPRKKSVPYDQDAHAAKKAPVKEQPAKAPAKKAVKEPVQQQAAPKRKGPRLGGVIFYTLYFLFIFLFFVAVFFGLQWLQGWLVDYEAAQPTAKSEEVFQQLFDDPDWGALYDAAGVADTQYEGKEAFVSYMEELVGDGELSYQLTSSGLSEDKKYFVNLDSQRLAYFTLHNANSSDNKTDIPDWQLGEVGLFYERTGGCKIQTVDGHVPYVNGIALNDDHVIQISSLKEDTTGFLPTGAVTAKTSIYQITGLMAEPSITVVDGDGNQRDVVYDADLGMYVEQAETIAISEDERNVALSALKVYAEYQIKEASSNEVASYFDSTGSAYKNIMQTVLTWTKGNNGFSFDNDTVTNYCRYSDTMFSAYVTTEMTIKLTDGGTTTKPINSTLLMEKQNGKWKVTKMTNVNIAEVVGKVRLTFMYGEDILQNDFVETDAETFSSPRMTAPDGKVFAGWYREVYDDNGNKSLQLVFTTDENGDVTIPSGTTLEPMILYPYFEDATAAAATEGA